jgi:hypothetical protein
MNNERRTKIGSLTSVFTKAADKLSWLVRNYPGKCVATIGTLGDSAFLVTKISEGSVVGVFGGSLGLLANTWLFKYGDPKITKEQQKTFQDPQDERDLSNWKNLKKISDFINRQKKYPWETVSSMRLAVMTSMFVSGTGLASPQASYGEMAYGGMAVLGYLVKIGVAERPQGSVNVPRSQGVLSKTFNKGKKFILENPNATAGSVFLFGLTPYMIEAIAEKNTPKFASALLYMTCDILVMQTRKRAQIVPEAMPIRPLKPPTPDDMC